MNRFLLTNLLSRKALVAVTLLCFLHATQAQHAAPALGKVDPEQLMEKTCRVDPHAPAMILYSQQETALSPFADYEIKSVTKIWERIKIYSRKGFEYANIKFKFGGGKDVKLTHITGFIHYLDSSGKVVSKKIDKEDIFKNKSAEGSKTLAFTFPDLIEGCIIEYAYTFSIKYSLFLPSWYFQNEIPTAFASCKVSVPIIAHLQDKIISTQKIETKQESKKYNASDMDIINSYKVENVPAFEEEPLMGSILNNYQRVEFGLRRSFRSGNQLVNDLLYTWESENRWMNQRLEEQMRQTLKGTDSILAKAKKLSTVMQKADYLIKVVTDSLSWDMTETCLPNNIAECWKQKKGSNAELNTLLLYLLRKSGVNCYPLLISTRENGKTDTDFVNVTQFNGLDVVIVDSSENFIVDASLKNLSSRVTPYNILNTSAFLIDGDKGRWLEVRDNRPLSKQTLLVMATLDLAGDIAGTMTTDYFDIAKHLRIKSKEKKQESGLLKILQDEYPEFIIDNVSISEPNDEKSSLSERFDFKWQLTKSNDYFYLLPGFLPELKKNPFVNETRRFDVDLGCTKTLLISLNLQIPEGIIVEALPKNITFMKSDSTISFRRISDVNGGMLRNIIRLEYKESQFPKDEYPYLKEFYAKMYELLNEPIILHKKIK